MLTRRLRYARGAPSAVAVGFGYVAGHRLTFDVVSRGKRQSSGKCDMQLTCDATDRVYGVLFNISKADEKGVDREEGLDRGHRKSMIDVVTDTGTKQAIVYIATQKDPSLRPYHRYKEFVVPGAKEHGLPRDYIERIHT